MPACTPADRSCTPTCRWPPSRATPTRWAGGSQASCRADIGVRAVAIAPPGFDARFSPLWRRYAYRLTEHPFGPEPLHRHDVVAHGRPLDVDAMQAASRALVGEHDFAAFCRRREGATTVRTLLELQWSREPGDLVVATFLADAFCHSMVRSLVGACLAVGEGRRAGRLARRGAGRPGAPRRRHRGACARAHAGRGPLPARRRGGRPSARRPPSAGGADMTTITREQLVVLVAAPHPRPGRDGARVPSPSPACPAPARPRSRPRCTRS